MALSVDDLPAPVSVDSLPAPPSNSRGEGIGGFAKDLGSAIVRPAAKAVAALPLMAMDAGIAGRNILGDLANKALGRHATPDYEMPSSMFNRALDAYTRPPTGIGKAAEFVTSSLMGARLPLAPEMSNPAPAGFISPRGALRNQLISQGQKEGYVVPPSTGNPTFLNRLMEGLSGKLKLQQEAALRNQGTTDRLMSQSVGESGEAPITQGALESIRSKAAQEGYSPIRQIGEIPTDSKYQDALDAIEKAGKPGKLLASIKPDTDIADLVKSLKQPNFEGDDAVSTIQTLRQSADDAFRAGKAAVGRAYKAAAGAIEDQIERHLQNQGADGADTLSQFRDARKLMAKTYTAGKALTETGNFNARSVASDLARGKPLEGAQRTVGQFASAFPKATRLAQESFPAISPLDAYGSAIASAASHSVAPLALPLTRVGVREFLLSPAGQSRALQAAYKGAPKNLGVPLSALLQSSGLLSSPSTAP